MFWTTVEPNLPKIYTIIAAFKAFKAFHFVIIVIKRAGLHWWQVATEKLPWQENEQCENEDHENEERLHEKMMRVKFMSQLDNNNAFENSFL